MQENNQVRAMVECENLVKIFKELCASEGVTIVMTTHDTGLMEIGDVTFQLEDGEFVG